MHCKTQKFIERSNMVHNNKYEYSKTIYKTNIDKVIIICPKHGAFTQQPSNHLRGNGCLKCAQEERNGKRFFVDKCQAKHGNKYDYSKSEYKDSKTSVTIICPKHGEFEQHPADHLGGHGCSKCGYAKNGLNSRLTADDFIKRANVIHKNKYDYDKIIYKTTQDKVIIICPEHGEFEQQPNNHLAGGGCAKCSRRRTTQEFIEEATVKHNNKYDYSKVIYKSTQNKITIICPEHGEFIQSASSHLQGRGCLKCVNKSTPTIEEFNIRATTIHSNKYDYSKVIYKTSNDKVIIVCPEHGEFEQRVRSHLDGNGCPKCRSSRGEAFISKYLETNNIKYVFQYRLTYGGILDFYLPDFNLGIEFNGRQHYMPVSFGSLTETPLQKFEYSINSDKKKVKYCQENKIKLLIIPFWDIEKINEILDQYFTKNILIISSPPEYVENKNLQYLF